MPSTFWTTVAGGNTPSLFGTTSGGTLLIFSLFLAIGVGASLGLWSRKYTKDSHWLAVGGFFMMLGFEAVIQMIDWIYVILPLIVTAAAIFYTHRDSGGGGG